MARKILTPAMVDSLKKGSIAVPDCAGLVVEATAGGKRVWRYRRRVSGSPVIVKMRLGTYPAYSIADARAWANDLNRMVERGENPRARAAAEAVRVSLTLAEAHALYITACERPDRKRKLAKRTIEGKRAEFRNRIEPLLGAKPVNEIGEDMLWELVEERASTSPSRANWLAGELKSIFKWCVSREGKMAGVGLTIDPALSLDRSPYAENERKRFLDRDEIALLFLALADDRNLVGYYPAGEVGRKRAAARSAVYRRAILLLMLTACRRNEVLFAHSDEYRDGVWTLPAERTKNGDTHAMTLSAWGRYLFESAGDGWIIPSYKTSKAMGSGWSKISRRLESAMCVLGKRKIDHWTLHDLRRTVSSNAENAGINENITEAMLNHRLSKVRRIYNRSGRVITKADGYADWEAWLIDIAREIGVDRLLGVPTTVHGTQANARHRPV